MSLHRAPAAAALLLAATLALSACSDDEPDTPPPSPTPSSTSASATATPSAKPSEPVLPEAVKEATEAGARAFITYYWDLINYAQVTGDVKALRTVSGPSCDGCNAGIDGVRSHYRKGGRVIGGQHEVTISEINEISTESKGAFGFHAVATASHDGQTIIASDGTEERRDSGSDSFDLYLL